MKKGGQWMETSEPKDTRTMDLPLAGLKVLEFGHTVMGPTCGVVLADLGADVIRVEPAPDGDPTRGLHGFATGFFTYFNRNKRCICINLKTKDGLSAARDLVGSADVLVENFGPGTMDRLGLGWNVVHALNRRLIYCALKGFLPGPYEERLALDEVVQHMTGLTYMTGLPGKPLRAGASVVDITAALMGVIGILSALQTRERDGEGRQVSGTLFETSAFLVAQHMAQHAASGIEPVPMSARSPSWSIYDLFPTRCGRQIFIGATSQKHWLTLCRALGLDELAEDPEYKSNHNRIAHRKTLLPRIASITATFDLEELSDLLERAKLPFSPVNKPSDLFEDPQMMSPGRSLSLRMPNGAEAHLPALPLAIDGQQMPLRLQPPHVGEHTDEVLAEIGYTNDEIARLRSNHSIA